ncbi:septation protein SpoVG family protein [Faecalibacterium prausnitzii]|uniref:septation protein SpoVG family protein n=1 Tax=Faecalibacterium prausnitzii TaxID=853 RepID=UPI003A7FDD12
MPRRYGADGTRLWNGKTPEEFTEADAYRFMAETEAVLQRKELMDDPAAQPAPASGKEEFYLSKKDDVLLTPEQIAAEERRWLFDAPIAELAEVKGVSIDEAVKMRTEAVLQEAVVPITVSVRPIEPQGKLIGFASVNFGGVVIDDFKVVDGKNGIFLGAPSKPDPASRTGYRATVRIPDRATQERINAAGVEAYHAAVEQLVARAQAVRPAPIKEQMAEAAKQAGKENAARPAPAKAKEARNDR